MRNHFLVLLALAAGALAFSSASLWLNRAEQRHGPAAQAGEVEDLRDLEDLRAVPIMVDDMAGTAGNLVAGDRVDVMLIREIDGQLVNNVVVQDASVLAVEQPADTGLALSQPTRTVTVEVDTAQAERLRLAQQVGRLWLTLHGLAPAPAAPPVTDQPFDPDIFPWYHQNAG